MTWIGPCLGLIDGISIGGTVNEKGSQGNRERVERRLIDPVINVFMTDCTSTQFSRDRRHASYRPTNYSARRIPTRMQ